MDLVGIKYALNAALGDSGFQALDELINSKITSAISSINTNTNNKTAAGAVKIVKNVQRGVVDFNKNGGSRTINISTINKSKAIVLINNASLAYAGESERNTTYGATLIELTNTSLTLSANYVRGFSDDGGSASWQVIEFY